jgi:DNA-binding GntR family transcriptional regulator
VRRRRRRRRAVRPVGAEATPTTGKRGGRARGLRFLSDGVYEHLKDLIVAGRLVPGEQILEDQVKQDLGVSRTPVREALQRLQFEGLVEVRPHKGTFVSRVDVESLREIFEFREAIEGQAAALAALRMSPEARAELQQLQDVFRQSVASGDPKSFHESDTRLHRAVVAACGNGRLQQAVSIIESLIARTRFLSIIALTRMEQSSSEHEAIIDAVVRGDPRAAEERMRNHIRAVYQNLTENLSRAFIAL